MKYISFVLLFILLSCKPKKADDEYCKLVPTENYYRFSLDADTRVPLFNLYVSELNNGKYLSFSDSKTLSILVYSVDDGKLFKKIVFNTEGPNGIGPGLYGYYLKDFDHIYIPSINRSVIYETDTTGLIRKVIDFSTTIDGDLTTPVHYTNHDNSQMFFIGDTLYIPQTLNRTLRYDSWVERSPTFLAVDTLAKKVIPSSMLHPHGGITSKDYALYIADLTYSSINVDNRIVYSFTMEDDLYCFDIHTGKINKYNAKSRYVSDVKPVKLPDDFTKVVKKTCEMPSYGNIMYDKYRKVYYRFAFPKTTLNDDENFLQVLHNGKKEFSVIILNEDFQKMGETKFPSFTYLPHISFITEAGLYISTNHFKRDDYSDDILSFQCFRLVDN